MPLFSVDPPRGTQRAQGTANAPGAGSNVCSIAANLLPAGSYRIKYGYIITGAQEAAALNVRLRANGIGILDLPSTMPFGSAQLIQGQIDRIDLDGANIVALGAAANSTASTVYTAYLMVDRLA